MKRRSASPWKFLDDYRGSGFQGEWPTLPELLAITVKRFAARPFLTVYEPDRKSLTYAEAERSRRFVFGTLTGRLFELPRRRQRLV